MSWNLQAGSPLEDKDLRPFLDAAFERPDQESRLVHELAAHAPAFDPSLALSAFHGEERAAWGLFLPRVVSLRDAWVSLCISSPFATLPTYRKQGAGRFLLETGLAALRDRGIRGALVIGGAEFFGEFGYAAAFNLYGFSCRREDLPTERIKGWRGLRGEDLPRLGKLFERCYRTVDGCERREPTAIDWEAAIPDSHCLAFEAKGELQAYLRFRIRGAIELRECGVSGEAGVRAVLSFLGQLLDEHNRPCLEAHLPPPHPVARALFHSGALEQASNFDGAALLTILDWKGLIADTAVSFERGLAAGGGHPFSMEIGGESIRLEPGQIGTDVKFTREPGRHLWTPKAWGPALVTGQRSVHDLVNCEAVQLRSDLNPNGWQIAASLFPARTPMWPYAPIFELADS